MTIIAQPITIPHPTDLKTDTVTGEYTATCEGQVDGKPCEWADVSYDYFGQLDRRIAHENTGT